MRYQAAAAAATAAVEQWRVDEGTAVEEVAPPGEAMSGLSVAVAAARWLRSEQDAAEVAAEELRVEREAAEVALERLRVQHEAATAEATRLSVERAAADSTVEQRRTEQEAAEAAAAVAAVAERLQLEEELAYHTQRAEATRARLDTSGVPPPAAAVAPQAAADVDARKDRLMLPCGPPVRVRGVRRGADASDAQALPHLPPEHTRGDTRVPVDCAAAVP